MLDGLLPPNQNVLYCEEDIDCVHAVVGCADGNNGVTDGIEDGVVETTAAGVGVEGFTATTLLLSLSSPSLDGVDLSPLLYQTIQRRTNPKQQRRTPQAGERYHRLCTTRHHTFCPLSDEQKVNLYFGIICLETVLLVNRLTFSL